MSPERAKEGEEGLSVALSGLVFLGPPTQGFALGFRMPPLWGFSHKMRLPRKDEKGGKTATAKCKVPKPAIARAGMAACPCQV